MQNSAEMRFQRFVRGVNPGVEPLAEKRKSRTSFSEAYGRSASHADPTSSPQLGQMPETEESDGRIHTLKWYHFVPYTAQSAIAAAQLYPPV